MSRLQAFHSFPSLSLLFLGPGRTGPGRCELKMADAAAELLQWTGGVISSSAFNLSMQVLRFLTFTACSSPLPLSASDRCRVELSACGNALCLCTSALSSVSSARPSLCADLLQSHARALYGETRFDTNTVKIICVQTVIALQTIRTTITHF